MVLHCLAPYRRAFDGRRGAETVVRPEPRAGEPQVPALRFIERFQKAPTEDQLYLGLSAIRDFEGGCLTCWFAVLEHGKLLLPRYLTRNIEFRTGARGPPYTFKMGCLCAVAAIMLRLS